MSWKSQARVGEAQRRTAMEMILNILEVAGIAAVGVVFFAVAGVLFGHRSDGSNVVDDWEWGERGEFIEEASK